MSESGFATLEIEPLAPHVTRIRLNRPDRLNAITFELVAELHTALDVVASDPSCKVVILTGAGRGFCAGLDLKDYGTAPEIGTHPHRRVGIDPQTFMSNLTVHLRDMPQVVIAAVNGAAYGGGLALACAADIRLAATLGYTIKLLGVVRLHDDRRIEVRVQPTLIPSSHILASVNDPVLAFESRPSLLVHIHLQLRPDGIDQSIDAASQC